MFFFSIFLFNLGFFFMFFFLIQFFFLILYNDCGLVEITHVYSNFFFILSFNIKFIDLEFFNFFLQLYKSYISRRLLIELIWVRLLWSKIFFFTYKKFNPPLSSIY
jgi:hypothetical protein